MKLVSCSKCGVPVPTHVPCPGCGAPPRDWVAYTEGLAQLLSKAAQEQGDLRKEANGIARKAKARQRQLAESLQQLRKAQELIEAVWVREED